jgi:hypothetical protein
MSVRQRHLHICKYPLHFFPASSVYVHKQTDLTSIVGAECIRAMVHAYSVRDHPVYELQSFAIEEQELCAFVWLTRC